MANIDPSEDIRTGTGNVKLVLEQAQKLWSLEQDINSIQATLKEKQEEYRKLACDTLPSLMESEGVASPLGLKGGWVLELAPAFRASLPAESTIEKANDEERPMLEARRSDGLKWLKANKAAAIIKSEIKTTIEAGQTQLAKALLSHLKKFTRGGKQVKLDITQKESVHPGTLSKLLREFRDSGRDIPLDTFAVFDGKEAKIKKVKEKK